MRLSYKILIPSLLLLAVLGAMSAGFYNIFREQQTSLRNISDRLAAANYLTLEMQGQHKTITLNLLSYRFDGRPGRLEAIAHADRETLVSVNAYRSLVSDRGTAELLRAFTDSRNQVAEARAALIHAVGSRDEVQTRLAFDKWVLQAGRLDATLSDLAASSVKELETAVHTMGQRQVAFIRSSLYAAALAVLLIIASAVYLQRNVGRRLGLLTAGIDRLNLDEPRERLNGKLMQSEDELASLGRSFNQMADRVHAGHAAVRNEIAERTLAQEALQRQIRLARLMESLARTANESVTPEEALRKCLVCISEHGNWSLGRLGVLTPDNRNPSPERSFWHSTAADRYGDFIKASADSRYFGAGGRFISVVLKEKRPVWLTDFSTGETTGRLCIGAKDGLCSAFAFPVVVHGEVIAFLEFFSEKTRAPDALLMDALGSVGSHLALVIERSHAAAEKDRLNAELEQRVEARTAELVAANRELESFSYSVSHDLRAPLRAIDGFSRLVVDRYGQEVGPEARRYLEKVRANTQQMGALVDDLLAFSRMGRQTLAPQRVDTSDLVRQCLQTVQAEYDGQDAQVEIRALPECEGDPALLRQVWMNLLANAFKFSSKRETPCVEIGSHADNGERVYHVRDNGVGFDMRYADKLFGVFQRLHGASEFPGTGVGLALVQRIVNRHGGRIWAEARPDQGATFYFTLKGAHLRA